LCAAERTSLIFRRGARGEFQFLCWRAERTPALQAARERWQQFARAKDKGREKQAHGQKSFAQAGKKSLFTMAGCFSVLRWMDESGSKVKFVA